MRVDPICGMQVDEAKALHVHRDGKEEYFCSDSCMNEYLRRIKGGTGQKYGQGPRSPIHSGHSCCSGNKPNKIESVIMGKDDYYTCPMHPDVRQNHPGDCPQCGMALELRTPNAKVDDNHSNPLSMKFWTGLFLVLPIVLLALGDMVPAFDFHELIGPKVSGWIQFVLATIVIFGPGGIFFEKAWKSIVNKSLNMFTLISLGVGAAYGYSAVAVVFPQVFPEALKNAGQMPLYFEAAAVIIVLVLLGQLLEAKARSQTGRALKALLGLAAKTEPIK